MPKSRRSRTSFQLSTGEDPSVWRYSNVEDALRGNIGLLARLIQLQQGIDAQGPLTAAEEQVGQRRYKEMKNKLAA